MSLRISYGYPLQTNDWEGFVRLVAARAGIPPHVAREHLADAERKGWIERVISPDGSIALRLTIPEHAI
jgi:hypothetical protein